MPLRVWRAAPRRALGDIATLGVMVPSATETPLAEYSIAAFLTSLAAKTPTPGGGAVACMVGATAAAQAEMVVAYSLGKKNLAEHQTMLATVQAELARARLMLLELADEDGRAYAIVNAMMKLPEGDAGRAGLAAATEMAASVPLSAMAICVELHKLCAKLRGKSNANLVSDLDIAEKLAAAAAWCAGRNVEINLPGLAEPAKGRIEGEYRVLMGKIG